MKTMRRSLAPVLVVSFLAACRSDGPSGATSSSATTSASAAVATSAKLLVDAAEVTTVQLTGDEPARALAAWLSGEAADPARWITLAARGAKQQRWQVQHPAQRYPGTEARVHRDGERLCLGLFRPAPEGASKEAREALAKPVAGLCDVVHIEVNTRQPPPMRPEASSSPAVVLVAPDHEDLPLTHKALSKLKKANDPRGDQRGWLLRDVVALRSALPKVASVEMVTAKGVETLDAAALASEEQLVILEQNRRGAFNVKVYQGKPRPTRTIRKLTQLRVKLRQP